MRRSEIPTKFLRKEGPQPETPSRCVGCGASVNPGFSYTGSVLAGMSFATIKSSETSPILGTIESYDRSYIIGGETIESSKKVGFFTRKKGLICEQCAGNYKCIVDSSGRKHEIVKTDPKPGFIGMTAPCESGNKMSYTILNTRYTR